jgi:hypothetical protein
MTAGSAVPPGRGELRTTRRWVAAAALATLAAGSLAGISTDAAQAADTPGLSLQILADPPTDPYHLGMIVAGDTIAYRFVVSNNTGGALHGLRVNDLHIGTVVCDSSTVAQGASVNCHAARPYQISQAEVDAGKVHNSAWTGAITASGTSLVRADAAPVDTPIAAHPVLQVQQEGYPVPMDVNRNGQIDIGEPVGPFKYVAINAGNVTLHAVTITNPTVGPIRCIGDLSATLPAPIGFECIADRPHLVTVQDVVNQYVASHTVITGYTPSGQRLQSGVYQQTALTRSLRMTVAFDRPAWHDLNGDGRVDAGDSLSYSAVLRNTGNYRLTAVSVLTARSGVLHCYSTTIAADDAYRCRSGYDYRITRSDDLSGSVVNKVTAVAPATQFGGYVRAATSYVSTMIG